MSQRACLRSVIRLILGDEEIHGMWYYDDAKLDSAIRCVFLLGRGPGGYALSDDQTVIVPDLASGDPYALVSYEAAYLLLGGEEGAERMQTRAVTYSHEGQRRRDLLMELRQKIYEIRDGAAVFTTFQNFEQFVSALRTEGPGYPLQFSEMHLVTKPPDITI